MVAWCEETLAVHRSGEPMATKLRRIAEKARKEPGFKFTSLYHLMNEELLRGCFQRLRKDAAAGIDEMTNGEGGDAHKIIKNYSSVRLNPSAKTICSPLLAQILTAG